MFLGVPTIILVVIIAILGSLVFLSFKISRWLAKAPIETDSKIVKRVEVLMQEKKQFNNFKQGHEVKNILMGEGYSELDITKAMNDYALLKAKASSPQMLTILLIMLIGFDFIVKILSPIIGEFGAQIFMIASIVGYIVFIFIKLVIKRGK